MACRQTSTMLGSWRLAVHVSAVEDIPSHRLSMPVPSWVPRAHGHPGPWLRRGMDKPVSACSASQTKV